MRNLQILEQKVTRLLQAHTTNDYAYSQIAPLVAKKSLMQNHLYEDLGFKNRRAMNSFMSSFFPKMAQNKPKNSLWKKYIYDLIGEVAPACATCSDSINCFRCKS